MTKKEQIVETAIRLFAGNGYENTSIQKLAEEAAVAQGLLYRHFKNKEALLMHLVAIGTEQVQHTLQPYMDNKLSFSEAFEAHIELTWTYLKDHRDLWKVIHTARLNNTIISNNDSNEIIKEVVLKPIINKLKANKYKTPEMHAWYVFTLIDGMTSLYLSHPGVYPLQKIKQFLIDKIASL